MIELREITWENARKVVNLEVAESQKTMLLVMHIA